MSPPEQPEGDFRYPLTRELKRGDLILVEDLHDDGIWSLYTQAEAAFAEAYGSVTEVLDVTEIADGLYDIATNLGTVHGARGDWTAVAK